MCESPAVAEKSAAGAPEEDKIEVTPAMIEAGLRALPFLDERYSSLEEGVTEIFVEMLRVSPYRSKGGLEVCSSEP
jgi:hypothetical protein